MNKRKKTIIAVCACVVAALAVVLVYGKISPTRIATFNYPDFMVEKFIRSNDNPAIKIDILDISQARKMSRYDIVMVRVHGNTLTSSHLDEIRKAMRKGVCVISSETGNTEINSLTGSTMEYVATLMENESVRNYRSLFNFLRKKIDRKWTCNGKYEEPLIVPADFYFHTGDDNFFSDFDKFMTYYRSAAKYREGAPNIAMLTGNINLQNSNKEHIEAMINALESKGLNVFPINSFGPRKIEMVRAVNPDLIIYYPHGRFIMGGAEAGEKALREMGVPLLAPVTVSEKYEDWLGNDQGMAAGGMTAMSVVLPELDGAIVPFAVSAQFERDGRLLFDSIPGHTGKFASLVSNMTELGRKANKDKKIAIYYYKGIGKGSVSAADIDGIHSLYNTLVFLKSKGYTVTGLPENAEALEKMIQRHGSVLGTYALGAYDDFLKNGNPACISEEEFRSWCKANMIPDSLVKDMAAKYGEFPGDYMTCEKDGRKYLTVARLEFGNIALLPQPMASTGDDAEKIIHGVKGAPAYPYVGSYLWTRNKFHADAIIHFGTHGSLEFIPGKQIALSGHDWTDALISDMPHFYIYTINNIGEGIIAKRRSYATLLSHLTAPFFRSDLYDGLSQIKDMIHRMELMEEGPLKQNYRESITAAAKKENVISFLGLDSTKVLDDEDMELVHIYLEEVESSKVNDGLYTLGKEYTERELDNTARLMAMDPVRYSLANLDRIKGKISSEDMENLSFMAHRYNARTERIISQALRSRSPYNIFRELVSARELKAMREDSISAAAKSRMMESMMQMAFAEKDTAVRKFLDASGNIIEAGLRLADMSPMEKMSYMSAIIDDDPAAKDLKGMERMQYARKLLKEMEEKEKRGEKITLPKAENNSESMMDKMAKAAPVSDDASGNGESAEKEMVDAVNSLKEAVMNISKIKDGLRASTTYEQKALEDALDGKYILPSSAGDPVINPMAIPTGRNFYAINPETTPSPQAWKVGKKLAESILDKEMRTNGKYPEKISFTLWSSDFISSEGATIAQILYLLGVEPLRDGFGYIRSLRLIPSAELGRPRIDVVVQTSGQLRDIAASRLKLIQDAINMAAADTSARNYVSKGFRDAEKYLLSKGFSLADARKYSKERIFGGVNGNYGTGIMGMVEKSDSWNDSDEIAERYISNMGALYSANGAASWGEYREDVFEAALLNTSVVVQPRSSNTWGPLSLDHVYEFMGGLSSAVRKVTGNDPSGYFNDFRNPSMARAQELKEAIGVETSSTVFNPKYIRQMMAEGSSGMAAFSETFRNTFGWNAMKPSAIDQHIWNRYYDVYIKDSYGLGLEKDFRAHNPYALEEMTAVMLEAARKDMWEASEAQIRELAELHASLVKDHEAACSGFVCDNASLKEFVASKVSRETADEYRKQISRAREVRIESENPDRNIVLKKDDVQQNEKENSMEAAEPQDGKSELASVFVVLGILLAFILIWIKIRKAVYQGKK